MDVNATSAASSAMIQAVLQVLNSSMEMQGEAVEALLESATQVVESGAAVDVYA